MSVSFYSIKQSAMSLPQHEREQLANELFDSLPAEAKREVELAWAREAEVRYNEIVSGKATIVTGEEVTVKIKSML